MSNRLIIILHDFLKVYPEVAPICVYRLMEGTSESEH
jgi:hypothetical protein